MPLIQVDDQDVTELEQLARDIREGRINRPPRPPGSEPRTPYVYQEYPKMLYAADYNPAQEAYEAARRRRVTADDQQREVDIRVALDRMQAATRTVRHQAEEADVRLQGWYPTPQAAVEAGRDAEAAVAVDAAVRAYDDRLMSPGAKAEVAQLEAETEAHVTDVPAPKKRPGRPPTATE